MMFGRGLCHARNIAVRVANGRKTRLLPVSVADANSLWNHSQMRMFAGNDDDSFHNDIVEEGESRKERPSNKLTADEMEFFDELNFENFTMNDEPNDEDDVDAELEKRKQMIDELDQRKGRGWSDPWEITDEDWMQKRTLEDLPDWTPALCSRISIERVKVYPGEFT
jgi:hypothetical protein